jgi:hypothetical protein
MKSDRKKVQNIIPQVRSGENKYPASVFFFTFSLSSAVIMPEFFTMSEIPLSFLDWGKKGLSLSSSSFLQKN